LRPLAVTARVRHKTLPEVPTVQEVGYPGYEVDIWYGLVAPARTPRSSVIQLAEWFTEAVLVSEVSTKLAAQGLDPDALRDVEFGDLLRKQYEEYGRIIRDAKIKAE